MINRKNDYVGSHRLNVMRDTTQRDAIPQRYVSAISGSLIICIPFGTSILLLPNFESLQLHLRIPSISAGLAFVRRWEGGAITKAYRAEYPAMQTKMPVL